MTRRVDKSEIRYDGRPTIDLPEPVTLEWIAHQLIELGKDLHDLTICTAKSAAAVRRRSLRQRALPERSAQPP